MSWASWRITRNFTPPRGLFPAPTDVRVRRSRPPDKNATLCHVRERGGRVSAYLSIYASGARSGVVRSFIRSHETSLHLPPLLHECIIRRSLMLRVPKKSHICPRRRDACWDARRNTWICDRVQADAGLQPRFYVSSRRGNGGSDRDILWVLMTRSEGGAGASGLMKKYNGCAKRSAARSGHNAVTLVAESPRNFEYIFEYFVVRFSVLVSCH